MNRPHEPEHLLYTPMEIRAIFEPYTTCSDLEEHAARKTLRRALRERDTWDARVRNVEDLANRPQPPVDTGKPLGIFRRSAFEELRITWTEYKGHPFVSLRVWKRNRHGDFYPDRDKGATIRLHEIQDAIRALTEAARLADRAAVERVAANRRKSDQNYPPTRA